MDFCIFVLKKKRTMQRERESKQKEMEWKEERKIEHIQIDKPRKRLINNNRNIITAD